MENKLTVNEQLAQISISLRMFESAIESLRAEVIELHGRLTIIELKQDRKYIGSALGVRVSLEPVKQNLMLPQD